MAPTSPWPGTWCFGPVVEISGLIVSAVHDGRIVAHDPATGATRWTSPSEKPIMEAGGAFRFVATVGEFLIASSAGSQNVTRINPNTGEVLWRTRHEGSALAPASIGSGIALVTHQPPVVAYDLTTGLIEWVRPTASQNSPGGSPPFRVFGAPLVSNGVAYFASTHGLHAKRIK